MLRQEPAAERPPDGLWHIACYPCVTMKIRDLFNVLLCSMILPCGVGCTGAAGTEINEAKWVSSEFSAGECHGECVFTLTRAGADLELRACTHENVCRRTNLGTLTGAGVSEIEAREAALSGAT